MLEFRTTGWGSDADVNLFTRPRGEGEEEREMRAGDGMYDGQIRLHCGLNGARDMILQYFYLFFKFGMSDRSIERWW